MIALGLDPGIAHCGFAALDGERRLVLVDVFTSKGQDRLGDTQARLGELLRWTALRVRRALDQVGGQTHDDLVVVEWPVVGGRREGEERASNAGAAAQTFAAAGGLIGMLRDFGSELLAPVPSSWRASIAGGRVSTEEVHAFIEHDYGITKKLGRGQARHALDAVGCALYGLKIRAARLAA